jgi:AcrR family transcriptional regulator
MARTKTVSDEAILEAAGRIMRHAGPAGITFAAVSAETGLAPPTLVQRYGSKERLMRAVLHRAWDRLEMSTLAADELAPVDAEGAITLLLALSGIDDDPNDFADGLLVLREDLRDPELRERGVAWGELLTLALGRRLASELAEQRRLGRLMASQWQGALLWWGFSRQGTVGAHIAGELRDWCAVVLRR